MESSEPDQRDRDAAVLIIFHPKWFERCIEFFKPLQFIPGKVEYQWEGFTILLQERLTP